MTVLLAGLRTLGVGEIGLGVFDENDTQLNTAFFEKILDVDIEWKNIDDDIFEGYCSKTSSNLKASAVDLIFGSNSRLRAISEVYASKDSKNKFVKLVNKSGFKVLKYFADKKNYFGVFLLKVK